MARQVHCTLNDHLHQDRGAWAALLLLDPEGLESTVNRWKGALVHVAGNFEESACSLCRQFCRQE